MKRTITVALLLLVAIGADCPMNGTMSMGNDNSNANANDNTSTNTSGDSDWPQVARLTAFDAAGDDLYGESTAAVSSLVAVGSSMKNSGAGIVDVYVNTGGDWNYFRRVEGGDSRFPEQAFGSSVALSNTRLFVGAPKYAIPGSLNIQRGALYVFANRGSDFEQIQLLTVSDSEDYDYLGSAMAYDADQGHLIVGAPGRNNREGAAYVYRDGGGTFTQTQKLTASDGTQFSDFGGSMAMTNVWAAIGAANKNSGTGAVYVFERMASDYVEIQKITAPDGVETDKFGSSVAMEGDLLAITAPAKQRPGDDLLMAGAVYVYRRSADQYMLEETIVPGDDLAGLFGYSVAVHDDRIAITAGGKGKVLIYEKSGDSWGATATIVPDESVVFDSFGANMVFLDEFLLVGSPSADAENQRAAGAAYIFVEPGTNTGPNVPPGVRV